MECAWTFEENEQFEKALAGVDPASPGFFEYVKSKVPSKSIEQIQKHWEDLMNDGMNVGRSTMDINNSDPYQPWENYINMIESGRIPIPHSGNSGSTAHKGRQRTVHWTEAERRSFLEGLARYCKGEWRNISKFHVKTRTPAQVASVLQKHFISGAIDLVRDVDVIESGVVPIPKYGNPDSTARQRRQRTKRWTAAEHQYRT